MDFGGKQNGGIWWKYWVLSRSRIQVTLMENNGKSWIFSTYSKHNYEPFLFPSEVCGVIAYLRFPLIQQQLQCLC